MRLVMMEVSTCYQCPYCKMFPTSGRLYCTHGMEAMSPEKSQDKPIDEKLARLAIPTWCPLPYITPDPEEEL